MFLRSKESGVRPEWQAIAPQGIPAKIYWSQWKALTVVDGVLYKKWESPNLKSNVLQMIVPTKKIEEILKEAHDSSSGDHFGVNKTLAKVRKCYYWATCKGDVEKWCATCAICIAKKGLSEKGKSPLQVYNVGAPFERIQVDILGPLPMSYAGSRYLLVVVDCFTKWPETIPLRNKRASTVAEALVNYVFSRHGVPLELHTDQGKNFESQLFQALTSLLEIRKTRTTPLHPQSDGQVERQHHAIFNYLTKFVEKNQKDWDRWVLMFLLAFRSSKHETTGTTPAKMYMGQDLRLPLDLLRGRPPCGEAVETRNYVLQLREKLDQIHQVARCRFEVRSKNVKSWYDRRSRQIFFEPGQKVWFFNPRRMKRRTPKLQSLWEGPYEECSCGRRNRWVAEQEGLTSWGPNRGRMPRRGLRGPLKRIKGPRSYSPPCPKSEKPSSQVLKGREAREKHARPQEERAARRWHGGTGVLEDGCLLEDVG
ncbi:hypothetical protein DMN91_010568 [Ooceraea biroi]|uniref:RNA-directed DNA polymerase n=1 Tax=Ooceraea biroi TaxID=2015173 RepID=A0A3L8D7Q5_OOCBI|nr:hypothetical protein DMN91_010568 [Ooceraea biroi]